MLKLFLWMWHLLGINNWGWTDELFWNHSWCILSIQSMEKKSHKNFKGYSKRRKLIFMHARKPKLMLQIAYMGSSSSLSLQHPLHKSLLRRRRKLQRLPNSRKPNPREWSRSHSTGSWMGSCLSSVVSKILSEVIWGKRLWKWGPNTDLTGHLTPHT